MGHEENRKLYKTEWGEALNFDDSFAAPVRELFIANAGYWIDEFHLDGLRLDATQMIYDSSENHMIAAIAAKVREAARGRGTYIVGENEPQDAKLIRAAERGAAQFVLLDVLKVPPVSEHGQVGDIVKVFGGAEKLREAVSQLQTLFYAA